MLGGAPKLFKPQPMRVKFTDPHGQINHKMQQLQAKAARTAFSNKKTCPEAICTGKEKKGCDVNELVELLKDAGVSKKLGPVDLFEALEAGDKSAIRSFVEQGFAVKVKIRGKGAHVQITGRGLHCRNNANIATLTEAIQANVSSLLDDKKVRWASIQEAKKFGYNRHEIDQALSRIGHARDSGVVENATLLGTLRAMGN